METQLPTPTQDVGALLQKARLLKNMTQAQMARRANLSERTLRKLEAGENVGLAVFLDVARELGYADDLLVILKQDKPTTFDEHVALGEGKYRRRGRAR